MQLQNHGNGKIIARMCIFFTTTFVIINFFNIFSQLITSDFKIFFGWRKLFSLISLRKIEISLNFPEYGMVFPDFPDFPESVELDFCIMVVKVE